MSFDKLKAGRAHCNVISNASLGAMCVPGAGNCSTTRPLPLNRKLRLAICNVLKASLNVRPVKLGTIISPFFCPNNFQPLVE